MANTDDGDDGDSDGDAKTVWIVKEIGGKGKASLLDKVGELADDNLRLFRVSMHPSCMVMM